MDNPADCSTRGLFPSELLDHDLWWNGPGWLRSPFSDWPCETQVTTPPIPDEEREVSFHVSVPDKAPLIALDRYSSFSRLIHIIAWIQRFIHNCRAKLTGQSTETSSSLVVLELRAAEVYWYIIVQEQHCKQELSALHKVLVVPRHSPLVPLHPIMDEDGILRVGGHESNSEGTFASKHPIILHSANSVTRLLIHTEHLHLLHGGATLLTCALS